jgi:esterase
MALNLSFETVGSGPPLLVLHGLFGSGGNWRSVARHLAATHTVHSADLRNHGASPWADTMGYAEMADDLLQLMDRLGLQAPAVIGHSMGGKVAMALALATPWAVGPLVVIDAAPRGSAASWGRQLRSLQGAQSAQPALPDLAGSALTHWMMPRLGAGHAYFDWTCRLGLIALSLHELAGFPDRLRYLSSQRPLHAIVGGRSDCVRPPDASIYQPMFPRTRVEVIEHAGHWVHADRPDDLLACLRAVLPVRRRLQVA